jgi:hypothetical protein
MSGIHRFEVITEPPEAHVTLDGEYLGKSPAHGVERAMPSTHTYVIEAKKEGYKDTKVTYPNNNAFASIPDVVKIRLEKLGYSQPTQQRQPLQPDKMKVRVIGVSDNSYDGLQKDRKEAIINAKREAIERSGVSVKSKSEMKMGVLYADYIEAEAESYILPGYEIVDIGYDDTKVTYKVVLVGEIKIIQK